MATRSRSTLGFTPVEEVSEKTTAQGVEETPPAPKPEPELQAKSDPVPTPEETPAPAPAPAPALTRVFPVVDAKQTRVPRNVPRFSEFKG